MEAKQEFAIVNRYKKIIKKECKRLGWSYAENYLIFDLTVQNAADKWGLIFNGVSENKKLPMTEVYHFNNRAVFSKNGFEYHKQFATDYINKPYRLMRYFSRHAHYDESDIFKKAA